MLGSQDDLYRSVIASFDSGIIGQRHIRQADGAGEGVVARAQECKLRNQGDSHVQWAAIRTCITKPQVNLQEAFGVAYEPSRLEGYRAAARWPICPVLRHWCTPACKAKSAGRSAIM